MKIVVVMPVNDIHKKMIKEAAPEAEIIFTDAAAVTEEISQDADIVIGNISPSFLKGNTKLQLLQLNSAGTDGYTEPGILPETAVLTNATGAYGLAISEHMLGMILCMMKKLDIYHDNMKSGSWADAGSVTSVYGSKTLIVGLGDIGSEFAMRMHALGSSVSAIKRNKSAKPEYIDKMYEMDQLQEALKEADIVATCLPGTPQTYKLFNADAFACMKPNSYFLNVGRGTAVDLDALEAAISKGIIAGAGLDVTDPEPLPKEHSLWSNSKVLVTPHVSGGYHLQETHDRIIRIAVKNIQHILAGEPVENIVDMKTGYRKNY